MIHTYRFKLDKDQLSLYLHLTPNAKEGAEWSHSYSVHSLANPTAFINSA